ncbi:hypothetical protein CRUP_017141 [Coryphaenoides rupestris]|nr:hypothetical protein CRUP_017141 [Coryphaenoides rupestris]
METVTALLWGPLSIWAVFAFLTHRPYRFTLQLIISLGESPSPPRSTPAHRDGYMHSEPGHPVYFWFYFVFMNVLWVVVPLALVLDAWTQLSGAQALGDGAQALVDGAHRQKTKSN